MRIAAGLAVSASGRLEIERSEGVGSGAPRRQAEMLEERLADEMRRLAIAQVDGRFAKMQRQQLRVHIGDVQERNVAECWNVVQLRRRLRVACPRPQRCACRRGKGQNAEK